MREEARTLTLVRQRGQRRPTAPRQRPDLRGKCAGIMETGRVIGAGGSRPCCYFEGARARRRAQISAPVDLTGWPTSAPSSAVANDQIGYLTPGEWPGVTAAIPDCSVRSSCLHHLLLLFPFIISRNEETAGMPQEEGRWSRQASGNLLPLKA